MSVWRRHAIYFAPPRDSALARFAAAWLGRDPESGQSVGGEPVPELAQRRAEITAAPRRYGFHATLKPPFALADGTDVAALDAAAQTLAQSLPRFDVPELRIAELGRFVALVPTDGKAAVGALADACVRELDRFRAPAAPEELARRRAGGLDNVEAAHLARWGYPYVFDRFVFHMTMTGPLAEPERGEVVVALGEALAPILAEPMPVEDICRFSEGEDGRFRLVRRFRLGR